MTSKSNIKFCESCDGPMSETGWAGVEDVSNWYEYKRQGNSIRVPKPDHEQGVCSDCANAVKQWEKECPN